MLFFDCFGTKISSIFFRAWHSLVFGALDLIYIFDGKGGRSADQVYTVGEREYDRI